MDKKIILAIVGLFGSGKTEAVEYLMKTIGWPKVYFGDVTFDEMKRINLEINEANERKTRERLREEFGQLIYADRTIEKIKNLPESPNVLVESLYSWEEYLEFKKEFGDSFKVLAIYASPEERIKRIETRPHRPLNREDAISRDYSQIENLHQAGPIARADFTILNEGTKEEFYSKLDEIIKKLS
ncbi:dephospho-CoA kinase [Candidatus Nomurabacteria bacterium CG_4_9_14_0_2_um_filter_32_10]|uniref:Dephospho-CoA kinase n=3 Tax=Candidatus Nomuraibacteriota TaxID=1752729 RepID=A0A2H0CHC0_9BACT|nr:MAG: dephospho-CoA kinase [Candidatus Nomurabacteria bacterium CG22_combo_CG10-13_8_21_14_all_32_8]PIZ85861.1 MAG: dephospho-CoA kinase [Candidatus Nomurabacteria bacterium CG_4_10_14_0_2_um_filter_33_9]PJC49368.1 MAG: dephospho-CoA kinase [Candidatus Nomurabacteria bacterium CG_4_9_14_0_2_um_filter_32_10]